MKKILPILALTIGAALSRLEAQPAPNYQWDFNLTNSASGTNLVYSTVPGGNLQGAAAPTPMGILQMLNSSSTPVNLLGLQGSGVATGPYDRAVLRTGPMAASGPILSTPPLGPEEQPSDL